MALNGATLQQQLTVCNTGADCRAKKLKMYQSKAHMDFILVINSNLPPILRRFQVMADYWSDFGYQ